VRRIPLLKMCQVYEQVDLWWQIFMSDTEMGYSRWSRVRVPANQGESALKKGCSNKNPFCCIHWIISRFILCETSWNFVIMSSYENYTSDKKHGIEINYITGDIQLFQSNNRISIWQLVPVLFRVLISPGWIDVNAQ
jgi:hypothetical protein